MRIAFLGTPDFAVPVLQALYDAGHDIAMVVAQPDKPSGRGNKVTPPPTIELARALGLPTMQPTKVKTGEFPATMAALQLDMAVVVAYGRILTPEVLQAPRFGCVNVHASLLPRWRGAAPIQWAILAGDAETGVCTQQMVEGLDAGELLLEARTPLSPEEASPALYTRLSHLGASLAVETLARYHEITPRPQDPAGITWARILTKEDGWMDWSRPAQALECQVRGLDPWPGTFFARGAEAVKVLSAKAEPGEPGGVPGQLVGVSSAGARIACGEGSLWLRQVQLPGRKPVGGADMVNGLRLKPGMMIGEVV